MTFTIIIPTYNRANLIGETLSSILHQDYTDWECIVVDDGSTDDTQELLRKWVEKDNRFKYIFQENAERSAARNKGILNAKGDYVCFLDSDDKYAPDHLSNINNRILQEKRPQGVFITGMYVIQNEEKTIAPPSPQKYKNFSTYFFKEAVTPSRVCIAKNILKDHKFDVNTRISEDSKLFVAIALSNYPVFLIEKPSVLFLIHEQNTVNVAKDNVYKARQLTLKSILRADHDKVIDQEVATRTINDCYFGMYNHHFLNKRYIKAFKVMVKAIFTMPNYRIKEKLYLIFKTVKQPIIK